MRRCSILLSFILIILILTACGNESGRYTPRTRGTDVRKPMSWGHDQTIYIFADEPAWLACKDTLSRTLEQTRLTTEHEQYFELKYADFGLIDHHYKYKNLIFLANVNSHGEVMNFLKERLSNEIIDKVKQERIGMFVHHNLWANDQMVVFLMADNLTELKTFVGEQKVKTFELFLRTLKDRLATQVYKTDVYPSSNFDSRSWKMQIPTSFKILTVKDSTLVFRARLNNQPDRYILVHREVVEKSPDANWFKSKRRELANTFYDGDSFEDKNIQLKKSKLGLYPCLEMWGYWINNKYLVGGGFQSFLVYSSEKGEVYIIDNSVYYPEGFKLKALLETKVISETFTIKKENQ
ncbi:MAG: DUF4837 family protein [Candidatus Cloacimonetes bacterium]|nr:DUF4837 family protein [Candidatus Cloacimonadota bacterium]